MLPSCSPVVGRPLPIRVRAFLALGVSPGRFSDENDGDIVIKFAKASKFEAIGIK